MKQNEYAYDKVNVKNICKMNVMEWREDEKSYVSLTYPRIGIVSGNNCYDILSDKSYPIYAKVGMRPKYLAYVFDYPFSDFDSEISFSALSDIVNSSKDVNTFKIFEENKLCKFKYILSNDKKITSIGYINNVSEHSIYDLINKKKIDVNLVKTKSSPLNNSDNYISYSEITQILKLRRIKQK